MTINKYLSSDKGDTSDDQNNSKAKAYYPFDDTGQLRKHQYLTNNQNGFKAWQGDENEDESKKSKVRNVIQAPENDEVVIRNFNGQDDKEDADGVTLNSPYFTHKSDSHNCFLFSSLKILFL